MFPPDVVGIHLSGGYPISNIDLNASQKRKSDSPKKSAIFDNILIREFIL